MKPNVYVYVIDSLRPDFVGCYNQEESNTPCLDLFCKESVRFTRAFSQDTWSKPAATAMLTGLYPESTGTVYRNRVLPSEVPTMASILRTRGYATLALSLNGYVLPHFGFDNGFDEFPDMHSDSRYRDRPQWRLRIPEINPAKALPVLTGADLTAEYRRWSVSRERPEAPEFTLLWNMDAHGPYFDRGVLDGVSPPAEIQYSEMPDVEIGKLKSLYRAMVHYADVQVGEFLDLLKSHHDYDNSLIVVCSDHGEAIGEHGLFGHAGYPFDELVHVPLWIKFPGNRFAGRVCNSMVELIDVLPTILDTLRIKSEWPLQGRSVLAALRRFPWAGRQWVYATGQGSERENRYTMIRGNSWKYISMHDPSQPAMPGDWYFNLARDPTEEQDLSAPKVVSRRQFLNPRLRFAELAKSYRERKNRAYFNRFVGRAVEAEVTEEVEDRLRALGYLE